MYTKKIIEAAKEQFNRSIHNNNNSQNLRIHQQGVLYLITSIRTPAHILLDYQVQMLVSYKYKNPFRHHNLFNVRKISNIYSAQNITFCIRIFNNFKGMCKGSISNFSTFLIANYLKNTCHLQQLYHTIQHQEKR